MEKITETVKKAKEKSKKRNFKQTWDFSINLKNIDLKKPENRITAEIVLPHGRGKDTKTLVITNTMLAEAKKVADFVLTKEQLEALKKDKKKIKKLANEYDWFFAEAPLMPLIGKIMGIALGPRGKMPKPIPPKAKLEPLISTAKKTVRIKVKDSPVIHVPVGTEDMPEEKVAENIQTVYKFVKEKLPKGAGNIKSAYIKLTMGPALKLNLEG